MFMYGQIFKIKISTESWYIARHIWARIVIVSLSNNIAKSIIVSCDASPNRILDIFSMTDYLAMPSCSLSHMISYSHSFINEQYLKIGLLYDFVGIYFHQLNQYILQPNDCQCY